MMALLNGFDLCEIKFFAEMGWLIAVPSFVHFDFFKLAWLNGPAPLSGGRDLM